MKTYVVGIAGGSASGKTTLAKQLASHLSECGLNTVVFSMDSYFLSENRLPIAKSPINNKEYRDFNHPESFDLTTLTGDITAAIESSSYQVIIVEGLLTLWDNNIISKLDLKLFVDCPADVRIIRRIRRNIEWGLTLDEIADVYLDLVRFRHDEFVEPTKKYADIIVDGSNESDISCVMLLEFIKQKLKDVDYEKQTSYR